MSSVLRCRAASSLRGSPALSSSSRASSLCASSASSVGTQVSVATGSSAARCGVASQPRRGLTDFAYVRPGKLPELKHKVRWRDSERYEAWKTATIPFVEGAVPAEALAAGHSEVSYHAEVEQGVRSTLAAAHEMVKSNGCPELFPVAALMNALAAKGSQGVLTDSEWKAMLAKPSEQEKAALQSASADTRKVALFALMEEIEQVTTELRKREEEAFDSGEVDLGVPLSQPQREELQLRRNRTLWAKLVQLVRKQSLLAAAVEKGLSHEVRYGLQQAYLGRDGIRFPSFTAEEGDGTISATEHPSIKLATGRDVDTTVSELLNDGDRARSDEERRMTLLALRDHMERLPRKKLSPPLQVGAPSVELENFARVLDQNPSMTMEQKKRILERYTDAVHASKPEQAFNFSAEKAAFVDPQPRWGVYDPDLVKKQDDLLDAARGAGKFSAEKGNVAREELFPPSALGEADVDPTRNPTFTASEEVAAGMAAYERAEKAKRADADRASREAVKRMLGEEDEAAADAILGPRKEKPQPKLEKGGAAAAGALPKGVSAPKGLASDEASEIVKTFFSRYMAGERMPPPPKPLTGEFKGVPPSANPAKAAAAAAPAAGKGKKKK